MHLTTPFGRGGEDGVTVFADGVRILIDDDTSRRIYVRQLADGSRVEVSLGELIAERRAAALALRQQAVRRAWIAAARAPHRLACAVRRAVDRIARAQHWITH